MDHLTQQIWTSILQSLCKKNLSPSLPANSLAWLDSTIQRQTVYRQDGYSIESQRQMKHILITTITAVLLVVCVEAQESSPPPETQSAGPTAYCQAQDIKPANPKADRALIDAVRKGSKETEKIERVKQAIAAGADLDVKMQGGYTPLHFATIYDHKEIAKILIAEGANVNAKNKRDMTPLHQAARSGRKEITELLIAKGADLNAKDGNSLTPLDLAIQRKKTETADFLRKHGGKKGAVYSIHVAAKGDIEAVKQHLAAGADVNAKDKIRGTPLHYAAAYGHKKIVELLIAAGADVNLKDEEEKTTLHYAAVNGRKVIGELLIAEGADVNAKDEDGRTPLDATSVFNKAETAALLRKHGGKTSEELKAAGK